MSSVYILACCCFLWVYFYFFLFLFFSTCFAYVFSLVSLHMFEYKLFSSSHQIMDSSVQWEAAESCVSITTALVLRRNTRAPPLHRHRDSLFPYYSPSLDFQHHHAHHYRCQKLCAEYELAVIFYFFFWGGGGGGGQAAAAQGGPGGRRGLRAGVGASVLTGRGEVRTPLHPGGPHRRPHYAGPRSTERRAHGAEWRDSLRSKSTSPTWPLSVCHSSYREDSQYEL